jgi:tetratricopeptide (TPR) repeat protein
MPNWWDKYPVHSGEAGGSALPTTGQESALTNPMAGMGTTPAYQSDEDWQAIAADVALNGGKGLSSIINQSPGHQQRKAYAEGIGKAQAGLAERQRAGMDVLSSLQQLVDTAKASQGEDAVILLKVAKTHLALGNKQKAIDDLRRATEKNPNYITPHIELALLVDEKEALPHWLEAVAINPFDPRVRQAMERLKR